MHNLLIFVVLLIVLLALRVPIYMALVISAAGLGFFAYGDVSAVYVVQKMYAGIDSFPLLALPLFMLTGELMNFGGLSNRLVEFANCVVGWIRGGLGFVVVLVCAFLAAILGSSSACSAMVGAVLIPAMAERGYDKDFSAAIVAASGGIGPIIPPSTLAILYAVAANVSINQMFLGGYGPGILMMALFMLYAYIVARRRGYPAEAKPTAQTFLHSLKRAIIPLLLPVIIMGSIMLGICTATESAVIAVVYCIVVSCFVFRTIRVSELPKMLIKGAKSGCIVLTVVAAANFLAYVMTMSQIPQSVTAAITTLTSNKYVFLLLVEVVLLAVGMFLDASCAIVVLTPILLPAAQALSISPLFFGVLMIVNLQIGILTPPVGLNLYVTASVAKMDVLRVAKACVPLMLILFGLTILMILCPAVVTAIPQLLL